RDLQDPLPELDEAEKECYAHWVEVSQEVADGLEQFEQEFGTVVKADEFKKCLARAQFLLAHWAPAVPARAVASRAHDVSPQEAEQIHDFLKRAPGVPGSPTWEPKPIPPGDPAQLR